MRFRIKLVLLITPLIMEASEFYMLLHIGFLPAHFRVAQIKPEWVARVGQGYTFPFSSLSRYSGPSFWFLSQLVFADNLAL